MIHVISRWRCWLTLYRPDTRRQPQAVPLLIRSASLLQGILRKSYTMNTDKQLLTILADGGLADLSCNKIVFGAPEDPSMTSAGEKEFYGILRSVMEASDDVVSAKERVRSRTSMQTPESVYTG